MQISRNLVRSVPLLAEFEKIQERINEATKQHKPYSLSEHEKELCKTVLEERAEVSTHNVSCHMACCRSGDKEGAITFLNAFCITPYRAVMLQEHRKFFGETVDVRSKQFHESVLSIENEL